MCAPSNVVLAQVLYYSVGLQLGLRHYQNNASSVKEPKATVSTKSATRWNFHHGRWSSLMASSWTSLHNKRSWSLCRGNHKREGPISWSLGPSKELYHVRLIFCRQGDVNLANPGHRHRPPSMFFKVRIQANVAEVPNPISITRTLPIFGTELQIMVYWAH